jgi:choline-sulfatase
MSNNKERAMKKNLIVISSDEMRGDCPGFTGNPDCKTPNLDKLAGKSVIFNKHFTVHGKCVPSRISMMTGRYAHTDGIRTINETNLLKEGEPNLLEALKDDGYETAYFGHNHVFENLYNGKNKKGESVPYYHSFTEKYFDKILEQTHPVQQPNENSLSNSSRDEVINFRVECRTEPCGDFMDDNRAEQAIHYLKTVRDKNRPFYMHLNFSAPHPPYRVEEPYFSMYDRDNIKPFPFDLPKNAPTHIKRMREVRGGENVTSADSRQVQAVYYGMITKLDTLIGKVLDAAEDENLFENSIIMFWVDHGDFAGQYGLVEKWDTAVQDCIMHVPQTIYAPDLPAGEINTLTEHTDIAPTILEMLDVKPDVKWVMHGESLLPIIAGEKAKTEVFGDGGHEAAMRARFNVGLTDKNGNPATQGKQKTYHDYPETMSRVKMVRTDEWKLAIHLEGDNELYNMKDDPYEMNNLYGQVGLNDIVFDLQERLLYWCLRTDTDRPFQPRVGA